VNGDQALIGCVYDVGLREPRPIRRGGCVAEREESRERLDREMRHRLEHRDLEVTATTATAALHECRENPLRGVQPGDGVGQRRAEKLRPAIIDGYAQEATQRLRYGVVARALGVGSIGAEAADGAVDELRIELEQPLG